MSIIPIIPDILVIGPLLFFAGKLSGGRKRYRP